MTNGEDKLIWKWRVDIGVYFKDYIFAGAFITTDFEETKKLDSFNFPLLEIRDIEKL